MLFDPIPFLYAFPSLFHYYLTHFLALIICYEDLSEKQELNQQRGASQVVLVVKKLSVNARDIRHMGLIPGPGRSLREGNGNPLQYSFLENTHGQKSLASYSTQDHTESARLNRLSTALPAELGPVYLPFSSIGDK